MSSDCMYPLSHRKNLETYTSCSAALTATALLGRLAPAASMPCAAKASGSRPHSIIPNLQLVNCLTSHPSTRGYSSVPQKMSMATFPELPASRVLGQVRPLTVSARLTPRAAKDRNDTMRAYSTASTAGENCSASGSTRAPRPQVDSRK